MISRALKTAVVDYLQANWLGTFCNCQIRVTPPPGKPYGCSGPMAITVWDSPVSTFSNIGHYTNNGCSITLSLRTKCNPGDRLDVFLDDKDGANDMRDWTAAFLDSARYDIMGYANSLVDMAYRGGIINGLIEAPRVLNISNWERKNTDWYSESSPSVKAPYSDMQQMAGYSCTIYYGDAKLLQYLSTATG